MTDNTLVQLLDKIIAFFESLKATILETEDENIIDSPALIGLENYISYLADKNLREIKTEKSKTEREKEIERGKNQALLGFRIFKEATKTLLLNDESIKKLSHKEQIEHVCSLVEIYGDNHINDMRQVISLNEEHHEGLKSAVNKAAGRLLVNSFIQKTKDKQSKAYRNQLFSISDKATKLSEELNEAADSLGNIIIGLYLSKPSEIETVLESNPVDQMFRMLRTASELKLIGGIRSELEKGELGPYFKLRTKGDKPDRAADIWVEELWTYLIEVLNVKPTVSREAGNSKLIEIASQMLETEITASQIYYRISKMRK